MGVGAYAASHLTGPLAPLGILLGGGIAALLGLLLGLPSLRIKGVYLAIATLAFQFLADYVFKTWEAVTGGSGAGPFLPPRSWASSWTPRRSSGTWSSSSPSPSSSTASASS